MIVSACETEMLDNIVDSLLNFEANSLHNSATESIFSTLVTNCFLHLIILIDAPCPFDDYIGNMVNYFVNIVSSYLIISE